MDGVDSQYSVPTTNTDSGSPVFVSQYEKKSISRKGVTCKSSGIQCPTSVIGYRAIDNIIVNGDLDCTMEANYLVIWPTFSII